MIKKIEIEPLQTFKTSDEFSILFGAEKEEETKLDEYTNSLISSVIYETLIDFFGSPETTDAVLNHLNNTQWKISE